MVIEMWFKLYKGRGIIKANFSITNVCNYRCVHCNIWRKYIENPNLLKYELSSQEFLRIVENTETLKWISITGGEPLLKKDLDVFLLNLPSNVELVSLNTNGSLPDKTVQLVKTIAENAPDRMFYVSISLDGPPEVHDALRGVKGAFSRAVSTYLKIKQHELNNVHVNFEYTVTPWNIGQFEKLLEYFSSNNLAISAEDFVISLYETSAYYYHSGKKSTPKYIDTLIKETRRIMKYLPKVSFRPSTVFCTSFLALSDEYYTQKKRHPCLAGKKSVWIMPNGDVQMCIYKSQKLGNIRDYKYDLNALVSSKIETITQIRNSCKGCWTPCESYTTLMFKPFLLVKGVFKRWTI